MTSRKRGICQRTQCTCRTAWRWAVATSWTRLRVWTTQHLPPREGSLILSLRILIPWLEVKPLRTQELYVTNKRFNIDDRWRRRHTRHEERIHEQQGRQGFIEGLQHILECHRSWRILSPLVNAWQNGDLKQEEFPSVLLPVKDQATLLPSVLYGKNNKTNINLGVLREGCPAKHSLYSRAYKDQEEGPGVFDREKSTVSCARAGGDSKQANPYSVRPRDGQRREKPLQGITILISCIL